MLHPATGPEATEPHPARLAVRFEAAALVAVIVAALVLRACALDRPALFVDESESAIDGLTILRDGVPTGNYLGLPLFENAFTRPWPDSPEYEFQDDNYSARGLAVYHSWLPLYAIAGSQALFGLAPDRPTVPPRVQHSRGEMARRIVAARAPAIAFSGLYLLAIFAAGRAMFGRDAGWIALTVAAFAAPCIREGRQARYYAATLALAMLCCLAWWLIDRRGRWRDHVGGGVVLALLFHCHVLSFVAIAAAGCLFLPALIARPGAARKLGVLAAIVVAATLPWAYLTGFLGHAARIPAARSLWLFPDDYLQYFRLDRPVSTVFVAGVLWLALFGLVRTRLPARIAAPSAPVVRPCLFLLVWIALGYAAFMLLIPAASAFLWRIRLIVEGPAILLGSILLAWCARIVAPKHSTWAAALILVALVQRQSWTDGLLASRSPDDAHYAIFDYLAGLEFRPGTRLYAAPSHHLTLTYLSGLPVQSIAPVRKSFLDRYEGDVLLIDALPTRPRPTLPRIRAAAARAGHRLSEPEARAWEHRLATRRLREVLSRQVADVVPPLEELPDYLEALIEPARRERKDVGSSHSPPGNDPDNPAIFRGYAADDLTTYWQVLFYRFVDPLSRSGRRANFADRLRGARAVVLDGWVVYHFGPPLAGPDREDVGHPGPGRRSR